MYKFQDLTPISGHFRTNFKISGISGQRQGLQSRNSTYNDNHGCIGSCEISTSLWASWLMKNFMVYV